MNALYMEYESTSRDFYNVSDTSHMNEPWRL